MDADDTQGQPARAKRRRYPIRSEQALKDMALRYVARFPCTTDKLTRYLAKKMREAIDLGEAQPGDGKRWIDAVVATLTRVRLLDDAAYAEARAMTLRRGRALRVIERDLANKGAPKAAIERAKEALREHGETDLTAAARLARKKKLGPFASVALSYDVRQKHLAKLARGGFSFDIAKRVMNADVASLEALLL